MFLPCGLLAVKHALPQNSSSPWTSNSIAFPQRSDCYLSEMWCSQVSNIWTSNSIVGQLLKKILPIHQMSCKDLQIFMNGALDFQGQHRKYHGAEDINSRCTFSQCSVVQYQDVDRVGFVLSFLSLAHGWPFFLFPHKVFLPFLQSYWIKTYLYDFSPQLLL